MIRDGSTVTFHYVLTIDDEVVDSSEGADPFTYIHGEGEIVPGLEKELTGHQRGDRLKVVVLPEQGYGHHRPDAVRTLPRDAFLDMDDLKVGDYVRGQLDDDEFAALVSGIDETSVTLDLNHPLAGKTLHFEVEVVAIKG